jgi:hypothetical protein
MIDLYGFGQKLRVVDTAFTAAIIDRRINE